MNVKELLNPGAAVGVLIYGLGYGIGFFSAKYLLKKKMEEQYAEELSEEAERMRNFYKVLYKKDMSPELLADLVIQPAVAVDDADDTEEDVEFEDGWSTTIALEDLELFDETIEKAQEILSDYVPSRSSVEAEEVIQSIFPEAKVVARRLTEDDIREITKDDVRYLPGGFDNVELAFFRQDGILCHEDGQVIYHPEMVISLRSFRELDDVPREQSRVYLLSEVQKKLWLIDMEPGAYADTYIQHSARTTSHGKGTKKFRVNDE